jgi:hypothetical protein
VVVLWGLRGSGCSCWRCNTWRITSFKRLQPQPQPQQSVTVATAAATSTACTCCDRNLIPLTVALRLLIRMAQLVMKLRVNCHMVKLT